MLNMSNLPEPMSKEEKQQLFDNWTSESWKVLAERNIRLALVAANLFKNTRIPSEDLFSIACMGLVKAAQRFQPDRGAAFSTFAIPVMKNEILLELRRMNKSVPASVSLNDLVAIGNDECELGELIQDGESNVWDHVLVEELLQKIESAIYQQKEKNRRIIFCFLDGIKQPENARINGVSQPQVSRVIKRFKNSVMEERG